MGSLTAKQKELLKWIVEAVKDDRLPEAGIIIRSERSSTTIENYRGDESDIPADVLSAVVLENYQGLGFIHAPATATGGVKTFECTLKQDAYEAAATNIYDNLKRFQRIEIEESQFVLLRMLAEASRSVAPGDQGWYICAPSKNGNHLFGPGLPGHASYQPGDPQVLQKAQLVTLERSTSGDPQMVVAPFGFKYYEYRIRLEGQMTERISSTMRDYLQAEHFPSIFPRAYAEIHRAEEDLWSAEETKDFTEIGHHCREGIREFVDVLIKRYGLEGAAPPIHETKNRMGAVFEATKGKVSKSVAKALYSLLVAWDDVIYLAHRQEHGAENIDEPLTWEDARRCVFLTMTLMVEIDRLLAPAA